MTAHNTIACYTTIEYNIKIKTPFWMFSQNGPDEHLAHFVHSESLIVWLCEGFCTRWSRVRKKAIEELTPNHWGFWEALFLDFLSLHFRLLACQANATHRRGSPSLSRSSFWALLVLLAVLDTHGHRLCEQQPESGWAKPQSSSKEKNFCQFCCHYQLWAWVRPLVAEL